MIDEAISKALETLAERHDALPVYRVRDGDRYATLPLVRRLGRAPVACHPWLPVGTLGPLLIMGHCNPAATDFWGVAEPFRIRVVIGKADYDQLHSQWRTKCQQEPLPRVGSAESIRSNLIPSDDLPLKKALLWFTINYPLKESERQNFLQTLKPILEKDSINYQQLDELIPQFGVALEKIRRQCLVYNPAYAPPLRAAQCQGLAVLDEHNAYPLIDNERVRYWLCSEGVEMQALEQAWEKITRPTRKIVVVLADARAISKRRRLDRLDIEFSMKAPAT